MTSYTPAAYTNFVAPATKPFNINVTVPPGTPGGTYTFTFKAFADSADVGTHVLTITVPRQVTVLTLKPAIVRMTAAGSSSSWSTTRYVLTANATLTTSSGAPVVGRQVSFDANAVARGTQVLCTGTTDSAGAG